MLSHSVTHTHTHTLSLSLSDTPQSVGLLWTRDWPVAETSTSQHTTFTRNRIPCLPWDSNPQFQQASGRRPNETAQPPESAIKFLCQVISVQSLAQGLESFNKKFPLHQTPYM